MPSVAVTSVKPGVTVSPPDTALSSVTVNVSESPSLADASATVTVALPSSSVIVPVPVSVAVTLAVVSGHRQADRERLVRLHGGVLARRHRERLRLASRAGKGDPRRVLRVVGALGRRHVREARRHRQAPDTALLNVTVNVIVSPSLADASATVTVALPSSSVIVPVPVSVAVTLAVVSDTARPTVNVSSGSTAVSSLVATVNVCVSPAVPAKLRPAAFSV